MITREGYSKNKSLQPEGIVVTWGKEMIEEKGGLLNFIRYFEMIMKNEDAVWLQKCRFKPKYVDILYVYIIVNNRVKYRCSYISHETGITEISNGDGYSWSSFEIIDWPRILLSGPVVHAPEKIIRRGFQGFRYCEVLF